MQRKVERKRAGNCVTRKSRVLPACARARTGSDITFCQPINLASRDTIASSLRDKPSGHPIYDRRKCFFLRFSTPTRYTSSVVIRGLLNTNFAHVRERRCNIVTAVAFLSLFLFFLCYYLCTRFIFMESLFLRVSVKWLGDFTLEAGEWRIWTIRNFIEVFVFLYIGDLPRWIFGDLNDSFRSFCLLYFYSLSFSSFPLSLLILVFVGILCLKWFVLIFRFIF